MMTLDEAIEHAQRQAAQLRGEGKHPCASEHEQLVDWLRELVERRRRDRCISHTGNVDTLHRRPG